jgi:hypothetical protein
MGTQQDDDGNVRYGCWWDWLRSVGDDDSI